MKIKWLDRNISALGPYLCLCLSEDEYKQAFKDINEIPIGPWLSTPQSNATSHFLTASSGLCAVVCLGDCSKRNPIEIATLLVHEAVHVWQEWCDYYGENNPGNEQEAYAIQNIAQELMNAYVGTLK